MSPCQKGQLVHNIAAGLHQCTDVLQQRMLAQYEQADPQYAAMVKQAIATYQK